MEVSMNVQSYSYTTEIKRNQTAENTSSFSEIQIVESQEAVGESNKTKNDWFMEICKKYPDASFIVTENNEGDVSDDYQYKSACDTRQFGCPGKHSYTITEEILEKMDDPVYRNTLFQTLDNSEKNYDSRRIGGYPYTCVEIKEISHCIFSNDMFAADGPFKHYIEKTSNSSQGLSLSYQEAVMKKISIMEDETYQKLVEDLFDDKDDKADSDKKRRMEQEYADRFETHQQYINGEISLREYSYN